MGRNREFFLVTKNKQGTPVIMGQFWELLGDQEKPPRRVLCTVEEAEYVSVSGRTRKRTEKEKGTFLQSKYIAQLQDLQKIQPIKPSGLRVSDIAKQWSSSLRSLGKAKTLEIYNLSISLYISTAGDHLASEFKTSFGIEFLNELQTRKNFRGGGLSIATQRKHIRAVQSMFNWAFKRRLIDRPVYLERPAAIQKDPESFDFDELARMKKHLEQRIESTPAHHIQAVELKTYYRAFILAFFTMLRVGAIWSLPLKNIDLERRRIKIKSSVELNWSPKKLKETEKPISNALFEFLRADLLSRNASERYYLDSGTGTVAVKLASLSRAFGRLWVEAGIPLNGRQPFHGIRKGVLSELAAAGATDNELQDAADHDSIETTRRHYITKKRRDQAVLFESIQWPNKDSQKTV